jgi:hypothetical protein
MSHYINGKALLWNRQFLWKKIALKQNFACASVKNIKKNYMVWTCSTHREWEIVKLRLTELEVYWRITISHSFLQYIRPKCRTKQMYHSCSQRHACLSSCCCAQFICTHTSSIWSSPIIYITSWKHDILAINQIIFMYMLYYLPTDHESLSTEAVLKLSTRALYVLQRAEEN